MMLRKPLLISSGEPAGIGPDLCLALAGHDYPLVVLGDKSVIAARADQLGLSVSLDDYQPGDIPIPKQGHLSVLSYPCCAQVTSGQLDVENASYVLELLEQSASRCMNREFSALVTAPVHKEIINDSGTAFTGHTEFFAARCGVKHIVMMLACSSMRVALVTTHLPLSRVPEAITEPLVISVIEEVHHSLRHFFGIPHPRIYVAGLNPHAGEGGYLGREEITKIIPALDILKQRGIDVQGPFPADTMFVSQHRAMCDAFVAMYHDQGLPVLKYVGFGHAVNVTLGLPIIRTSVDHGTALELAGSGRADPGSMFAAVEMAAKMVLSQKGIQI